MTQDYVAIAGITVIAVFALALLLDDRRDEIKRLTNECRRLRILNKRRKK